MQFPNLDQIVGLCGVLAALVTFYLIGAAVTPRTLPGGLRIVSGWGVATLVFSAVGVLSPWPLSWACYLLLAAAAACAVGLRARLADREMLRLLVLALPMLIGVSAMYASQWDEFTNWLPNQRFLFEFDRFPQADLPPSLSVFPAYPFGLPLIGHFAAAMTGNFIENAGALFNTALIAVLASLLARQFAIGIESDTAATPGWGLLALGLLAASVLNPTFVPKLVFTTYVDFTTAVVLAGMAWLVWQLVEGALRGDPAERLRALAWLSGLSFAALVNLKQPNLLLGALVAAAGGALLVGGGRVPARLALALAVRVLGPAALAFGLWRFHVMTELTGGEFGFRPLAQWIWADAADIALLMVSVASKKGGYFGVMLAATVGALLALRRGPGALARLAIIAAVVFWGWNLFLFVSYLGSFAEGEGRSVASYWRYNTQLGGVAMLVAALAGAALWRRYVGWRPSGVAAAGACVLVLASPVLGQRAISFDRAPPKDFIRKAAQEVATLVPERSVVGTLDPGDNGEYMVFLRYALYRVGSAHPIAGVDWSSSGSIAAAIDRARVTHLWVRGAGDAVTKALQLPLEAGSTYLLERAADGWHVARQWPTVGGAG